MFYTTFEELCRARRIAPSAVARQLGMSSSAPGRWKNGSSPDLDTAMKIADFFGVSIDALVNHDGGAPAIHASDRSTVAYGNSGAVAMNGGTISQGTASELSDMERELLRVFRSLGMRQKNALLSSAYDMEDAMRKEE